MILYRPSRADRYFVNSAFDRSDVLSRLDDEQTNERARLAFLYNVGEHGSDLETPSVYGDPC